MSEVSQRTSSTLTTICSHSNFPTLQRAHASQDPLPVTRLPDSSQSMATLMPSAADEDSSHDWHHAIAVADIGDPNYVVSSPNMEFIPVPHVGIVQVMMRSDYRYGVCDPIQWPQLYIEDYSFLCAVLRPTPSDSHHGPLWWTPREETDFDLLQGSVFTCLGLLKPGALRPLSELVDELSTAIVARSPPDGRLSLFKLGMTQAFERLMHFPSTFRDAALQVREAQRYWLMAHALMLFEDELLDRAYSDSSHPVNRGLMGAFTTDPGVVQTLFKAGVPVWHIRSDVSIMEDTRMGASVIPTPPTDICVDSGPEGAHVVYTGLSSAKHIIQTMRFGHTYLDLSRAPLLAVDIEGGYPAQQSQRDYKGILVGGQQAVPPTRTPSRIIPGAQGSAMRMPMKSGQALGTPYGRPHRSQVRGVNKFEPFQHDWMPGELPAWSDAFRNVDLSQPARPVSEIWGYWIPEPALLLRPKTLERRDRYIMTWLRLRAGWLYLLRVPDVPVTSIPVQWWRDVLYGYTGRTGQDPLALNSQRWKDVEKVFGSVFQAMHFDSLRSEPVWWYGHRVQNVDSKLCPGIIWEMYDLGFRYELLALDRLLVPSRNKADRERERVHLLSSIFPGRHLFSLPQLPLEGTGLYSQLPHRRAPYLEAFRQVTSRWPGCPAFIHDASPISITMTSDEIASLEKILVKYYVDTFFAQSGRAPIVPHQFPSIPQSQ